MPKRKIARRPATKSKKVKKVKKWREVPTTALVPDEESTTEDPVAEVEEPELTPEDEDVEDVLQQLPQDAKVELWVWDTKTDDWGYITRYPAHGFSIDTVAREYGPGKYRMIIRGPIEGRMRIRGRKMFVIGGPALAVATGAGPPDLVSSGLVDLIKIQSEVMRANLSRPQESMGDVVKTIAELMRPATPAVDPFKQSIEILQLLREGGGGGEKTALAEVREILEMGMELGGGGSDDGLNVFGKSLAKLLDKMDTKPDSAPTPGTPAAALPAQTEAMRVMKEFFETANVVLGKAAARNADLDFYAEWMADNVPDTLDPFFAEWFGDPGFPDVMLSVFPGVAPDWLRPLLLKARALLTEEEEPGAVEVGGTPAGAENVPPERASDGATTPERRPGDIPDTPGNDGVRERRSPDPASS